MNDEVNKKEPFEKILDAIQGKSLKEATMGAQKIGTLTPKIINYVSQTIQYLKDGYNMDKKTPGYIDRRILDEARQKDGRTLDNNYQNNGQFGQQFNETNNFYDQQNYGEYRQQEDNQQRNDDMDR